jgi:HD-GYP domain-containing protein (c-di-GMP phosphodiesterase class II)
MVEPADVQNRLQSVEQELAAAHATIRQLQQAEQHKAEALSSAQAQLLLYAADLHQAYTLERARTTELERTMLDLVVGMVNVVEARDTYTGGHSQRVTQYAQGLSRVLGWSNAQLQVLEMGGRLHDIGKIGIPDRILQKAGPLTAAEYREMQTHVVIGMRILDGVRSLAAALPYVSYHHEHYDGQGYPFGLAGAAIPVEGRLLAVADALDAITSARPYRAARPLEDGLQEILAHRGTQFDPEMVDALQVAYASGLLCPAPAADSEDPVGPACELKPAPPWVPVTGTSEWVRRLLISTSS